MEEDECVCCRLSVSTSPFPDNQPTRVGNVTRSKEGSWRITKSIAALDG
jgi:hypothetical protein